MGVSLPYLAAKWTAPSVPTDAQFAAHALANGTIPLDDGRYHGSFQDFAFRLRYNITAHPFLITPFIQYNLPSNNYLFYSHAVVGRNVNSIGIGTYLGGLTDRILRNSYMQGLYSLNFEEKILGYSRNVQIMEYEFGYFVTPPIKTFAILAGQITNGGINVPYDIPPTAFDSSDPIYFHQAQISRNNDLEIGLGGHDYRQKSTRS